MSLFLFWHNFEVEKGESRVVTDTLCILDTVYVEESNEPPWFIMTFLVFITQGPTVWSLLSE